MTFLSLCFSVRLLLCFMRIESLPASHGPASLTGAESVGESSAGLQPELVFLPFLKVMLQEVIFSVGKCDDKAIQVVKRPVTNHGVMHAWNNLI